MYDLHQMERLDRRQAARTHHKHFVEVLQGLHEEEEGCDHGVLQGACNSVVFDKAKLAWLRDIFIYRPKATSLAITGADTDTGNLMQYTCCEGRLGPFFRFPKEVRLMWRPSCWRHISRTLQFYLAATRCCQFHALRRANMG